MGYIRDSYVQYFYRKSDKRKLQPIINRGYFARVHLIKKLIRAFCTLYAPNHQPTQTEKIKVQVVALGAGFDTTFWNMLEEYKATHDIYFVETDFEDVVAKKSRVIGANSHLHDVMTNATFEKGKPVHKLVNC
jgi:O-methyltransferase involved in polyketide biosynthesis